MLLTLLSHYVGPHLFGDGRGLSPDVAQANILQPLTHESTLRLRHDAVEELAAPEGDLSYQISQALSLLPRDLDKVAAGLAITQSNKGPKARIAARVQAMILLRWARLSHCMAAA